ncbi:MAG: 3-oxoadipyl-CoA thiolase [Myxococcaceae bacterium]|nr:3-oxoadipyl-CoA thiolase [Myxococcaceae bacterium]
MSEALICDVIRTPIGRLGGALASVRADDLAALPVSELMKRNPGVDWAAVDEVVLGCANQSGEDNRNVARMAALLSGLPERVPGVTVNRLCASGLEAVAHASRALRTGEAELVIAGGVESMTRAPYVLSKADGAFGRGQTLEDTTLGWRFVNPRMRAKYGVDSMSQTAENVAKEWGISRADQDAFALRSQQRVARAREAGFFDGELLPVTVSQGKSELVVKVDEHPRSDTTLEQLARLKPVMGPEGCITAGNASGLNDGACALLLASEEAARRYGLKPIARVLGSAACGVAPRVMGVGPVPAVRKLLERLKLSLKDMAVIELNEAFAAQALAVLRDLGVPDDADWVNPNGGAIALGHPLGASGARLVSTAARELVRRGGRYALVTLCVGVGQGQAMVLERVE